MTGKKKTMIMRLQLHMSLVQSLLHRLVAIVGKFYDPEHVDVNLTFIVFWVINTTFNPNLNANVHEKCLKLMKPFYPLYHLMLHAI